MDEDTFRAFYDRTARPVWAYLSRMTGDRQLADDLLQETYYRFLRADRGYASEAHRRNYLFRIATNLVRDGRRRRRPELVAVPEETDRDALRSHDDVAGRTVLRADLSRAMASLSSREQAMLWLAYAQGSSHDEIAEVAGSQDQQYQAAAVPGETPAGAAAPRGSRRAGGRRDPAMNETDCLHEEDVADAVMSGRWPAGCDAELVAHAASCAHLRRRDRRRGGDLRGRATRRAPRPASRPPGSCGGGPSCAPVTTWPSPRAGRSRYIHAVAGAVAAGLFFTLGGLLWPWLRASIEWIDLVSRTAEIGRFWVPIGLAVGAWLVLAPVLMLIVLSDD